MPHARLARGWLFAAATMSIVAVGCKESGDAKLDRLHPGPCTATQFPEGGEIELECVMAYDDAGRLTGTECAAPDDRPRWVLTRVFSGDELTEVTREYAGSGVEDRDEAETWTFGGDTITNTTQRDTGASGTVEVVRTYESEGFQFLGHPSDPAQSPQAPDSLIRSTRPGSGADPIEYTYDGPPREGARTRIGSDGTIVEFAYDTAGRLVAWNETVDIVTRAVTYEYAGDLLSQIDWDTIIKGGRDDTSTVFEHDVHGNLIAKRFFPVDPPIHIMEFGYGCW